MSIYFICLTNMLYIKLLILRATRLTNKLLEQGYVKERLKSALRKFYGRYWDLIKQYEVSLSQMSNDILWSDHIQWQPPTGQTLYRTRPFTEFWVVSIEHFRRVWHADRGRLLPPDTWSYPIWDLHLFIKPKPHYLLVTLTEYDLFTQIYITELERFQQNICNGWGMPAGTFTPPDTLFRPFGTCICSTCWDQSFSELVIILPDYALRISLGTFSIFLAIL